MHVFLSLEVQCINVTFSEEVSHSFLLVSLRQFPPQALACIGFLVGQAFLRTGDFFRAGNLSIFAFFFVFALDFSCAQKMFV